MTFTPAVALAAVMASRNEIALSGPGLAWSAAMLLASPSSASETVVTVTSVEAAAGSADLIVLASKPPSFWSRFFAPLVPRVVERVIREASCGVFLTTAKKWFNCENILGRPEKETEAAADHLNGALETGALPVPLTEDAFASAREQHHVAA